MMRRSIRNVMAAAALLAMLGASCGGSDGPEEIVLLTHDSFAIPDEVLATFAAEHGTEVRILRAGDAGTMLSQAILTKANPIADVLFGIDNTLLSRGLEADLFVPHSPALLDDVRVDLKIDTEGRVTPIDFGNVCLNFDKSAFGPDLPVPTELSDLADPAYAGMLVVEDPATSSPGLAFLLATIAAFPEGSQYPWTEFWRDLVTNDVLIVAGWEEAYYGGFSGATGAGDRPLVVSYASSPPFEMIFGEPPPPEPTTGVILDGCFRQIEFAGVLRGSAAEDTAKDFIDFMLSPAFQNEIPLNMFVFPANVNAVLPDEFVHHATVPETTRTIDPATIAARRNEWITMWTEVVR